MAISMFRLLPQALSMKEFAENSSMDDGLASGVAMLPGTPFHTCVTTILSRDNFNLPMTVPMR